MSIGERITELRKKSKLSQGQLASLLDVSRQAVSKWENDLSCPDTLKMIQLADILDTEVEYLATGRNAEPSPVVVKTVEIQEKIVEKPVIKVVEKSVPKYIERIVEKPILKRVIRVKYLRNPIEFTLWGIVCFLLGVVIGKLI